MILRDQWVVWSESEGYRLQVSRNGVTKEVPIDDDDVIEFMSEIQRGNDHQCYTSTIKMLQTPHNERLIHDGT